MIMLCFEQVSLIMGFKKPLLLAFKNLLSHKFLKIKNLSTTGASRVGGCIIHTKILIRARTTRISVHLFRVVVKWSPLESGEALTMVKLMAQSFFPTLQDSTSLQHGTDERRLLLYMLS